MTTAKLMTTVIGFREFARGLLADRAINKAEAQALLDRMTALQELQQLPIMRTVNAAIRSALQDAQITDQESDDLVVLLGEIVDADPDALISSTRSTMVDGPTGDLLQRLVIGDEYQIVYTGSDGKPGERNVLLKSVREKDGAHYLACYCLKAKAARTFLAARVSRAVHVPTGEILL